MPHKYARTTVRDILRSKKASVRRAPNWSDDFLDMTWEELIEAARSRVPHAQSVKKLLTDLRFDR